MVCILTNLPAQIVSPEVQTEAVYLCNFAKFTEWPAGAYGGLDAPLEICAVGHDPFGAELMRLTHGKSIAGHPLAVVYPRDIAQARSCHILFIARSEKKQVAQILSGISGTSVLTVSDMDEFTNLGGMISLVAEQDQLRFEVNLRAARAAGLKISSRLLTSAKNVFDDPRSGDK